jgi:hypothetical protein
MTQRFVIGLKLSKRELTVPQLRAMLETILEATEHDASLSDVAGHVQMAIDTIDMARATALAVMREAEAERAGAAGHRLC